MASLIVPTSTTDTSRFEYVKGQLRERPLPNQDHALVQFAVVTLLRPQAKSVNHTVLQEWTLDRDQTVDHEWLTPDVLIVSNEVKQAASGHALPPALLAVEILSPGQSYVEMREKALDYFAWGVLNVWVIDPVSRSALSLNPKAPNEALWLFEGGVLEINLTATSVLSLAVKDIFEFA